MSEASREQRLNDAFVKLADTLVDDYDVVDLLHELVAESAALLDIDAGGLLLADDQNQLQVVASTSEEASLVEIMQLNAGAGPCVDCFTTGTHIGVPDIAEVADKWPDFSSAAASQGFRSMFATPLRLRGKTIGAMNLFSRKLGAVDERDVAATRALADVATIGILQERLVREGHVVTEQLQHALDSRVVIEQAKGVLSELRSVGMDEAFTVLRAYARSHNVTLRSIAEAVVDRSLSAAALMENAPLKAQRR